MFVFYFVTVLKRAFHSNRGTPFNVHIHRATGKSFRVIEYYLVISHKFVGRNIELSNLYWTLDDL